MAAESIDIALEDAQLLASMENDETLQSAEVVVLSCATPFRSGLRRW